MADPRLREAGRGDACLDRPSEAEAAYGRAIEFAGSLMERSSNPARATIDRADVREALRAYSFSRRDDETPHGLCWRGRLGTCARCKALGGSRRSWARGSPA